VIEFYHHVPTSPLETTKQDNKDLAQLIEQLEFDCDKDHYDDDLASYDMMASPERTKSSPSNPAPAAPLRPSCQYDDAFREFHGHNIPALTIVLNILCTSIRNSPLAAVRAIGLCMLKKCAPLVDDHCRLDILLPYSILLVHDPVASLRARAIHVIVSLLECRAKHYEKRLMIDYVLPALSHLASDRDEMVRVAFAHHLGTLAAAGKRLTEAHIGDSQMQFGTNIAWGLHGSGSGSGSGIGIGSGIGASGIGASGSGIGGSNTNCTFDGLQHELQQWFVQTLTIMFAAGCSAIVKRALLHNIAKLAATLSYQSTSDFLLPFLTTFLNDNDYQLRRDFFRYGVELAAHLTPNSTLQFLSFCSQGVVDIEETVVTDALYCIEALVSQGGIPKRNVIDDVLKTCACLLCHPNIAIRLSTASLIHTLIHILGPVDSYCYLLPLIRPYFVVCHID
jgi:phosphoinositide-3-kinase, regulatory subunit 4